MPSFETWIEASHVSHPTSLTPDAVATDETLTSLHSMFTEPDDRETFSYSFPSLPSPVVLEGVSKENGQTLSSTGLTIWRASEYMCSYLLKSLEGGGERCYDEGSVALELGSGLGLPGILLSLHQLELATNACAGESVRGQPTLSSRHRC